MSLSQYTTQYIQLQTGLLYNISESTADANDLKHQATLGYTETVSNYDRKPDKEVIIEHGLFGIGCERGRHNELHRLPPMQLNMKRQ
jgi:hypothetical protein